jgi:alpha-1,6-mannosyltransferase
VNLALYLILVQDRKAEKTQGAIALLTFATVVFRSEIFLLLVPVVLQSLFLGYTSLLNIVRVGLISGLISLGSYGPRTYAPYCV